MRFLKFVMCVDMILYMKSGNQILVDNVDVVHVRHRADEDQDQADSSA